MYEPQFGLQRRPFAAAADADYYVPIAGTAGALETLTRVVERASGAGLIIGPAGTGKTLLCQLLARTFADKFRVVTLASARLCTRRALLQNMLFEMQLPFRGMEEGELRLSLIDHLEPSETCPHGMLLIVDEAHSLPIRLLEEIRMITNLVRDGQPRVRLVLAGGPVFEERLASPKLESFNQRIAARCYLQGFNREETAHYVRAQLADAGGDPEEILNDEALRAVFHATDGIPRLINQVCDHALMLAAADGVTRLDARRIEMAWADLQQLPAPWNGPEEESEHNILEFGPLGDESSENQHSLLDDLGEIPDHTEGTEEEPVIVGIGKTVEQVESALDQIVDQLDESELAAPPAEVSPRPTSPPMAKKEKDFQPHPGTQPEVELVFHNAHDVFGDTFQEEEIVIDRYARMPSNHPLLDARHMAVVQRINEAAQSGQQVDAAPGQSTFDPRQDPVYPESAAAGSHSEAARSGSVTRPMSESARDDASGAVSGPLDDRDLLEIEPESAPHADDESPPPIKKQQYRQLFASLRNK